MDHVIAARAQMGTSLAFHIVFAALGVGLPLLVCIAEGLWLRTRERAYYDIDRTRSQGMAILFAVGAVSGTILSFELGLLWPVFMKYAGSIIGLPFSLEGFAFFIEAIFIGLYLHGWDKLSPRMHWLAILPVVISGFGFGRIRHARERLDANADRLPARQGRAGRRSPARCDVRAAVENRSRAHRARRLRVHRFLRWRPCVPTHGYAAIGGPSLPRDCAPR
jgi:hypothetical protein